MGKTMLKEEEFKLDCHKDFLPTPIPSIAEWHLAVKLDMVHEHWVLPLSGKDPEVRWARLSYGDVLTETDWNSVENMYKGGSAQVFYDSLEEAHNGGATQISSFYSKDHILQFRDLDLRRWIRIDEHATTHLRNIPGGPP